MSVIRMRDNSSSGVGHESKNSELLYNTLVQLIRHCDEQVAKTTHYYVAALVALIPIATLLRQVNAPWPTYVGILVVALGLALRLFALSSKVTYEKLCWVRQARTLEQHLFIEGEGPFLIQQAHFAASVGQVNRYVENLILKHSGPVVLKRVALFLLFAGIVLVIAGVAFMNKGVPQP